MAVIHPAEPALRRAVEQNIPSLKEKSLPDLCHANEVKDMVMKACNVIGKRNGFKPLELLEAVVLTPDEWTPESGLVTAAQKIQRKKISAFKPYPRTSTSTRKQIFRLARRLDAPLA